MSAAQAHAVVGPAVLSVSFDLPGGASPAGVSALQDAIGRSVDSALRTLTQLRRGESLNTVLTESEARLQPQDASETLSAALRDPLSVASVGVTAGLVWWLTRAGGLMATMLMSVPAWRHVDVMSVLAARPADEDNDDDDAALDDSRRDTLEDSALADLFERRARRANERPRTP